jgi:hypothetical protein
MALDQYGPCPCGSGKKLKFCCAAAVDLLEQAEAQLAQGQTAACRNLVKQAEAKAPESPWVQVVKARCEVSAESWDAASAALRRLFELVPDHPEGLAIKVVVDVRTGHIDDIDEEIDKVFVHFQRVPRHQLEMLAMLRSSLPGTSPLGRQRNLMLALTLTRPENRGFVLEQAMRAMSDRTTSYLLRWDYPLRLPKERKPEYDQALVHARCGAFITAADDFAKLAESAPNDSDLQWNLGLCRAWNSENQLAAQALHRSAELDADFDRGAETEALAQSLDALDLSGMVPLKGWGFVVKSTSRLLTLLDQHSGYRRVPVEGSPLAAAYEVPAGPIPSSADITLENAPELLAMIEVYPEVPEEQLPARVAIYANSEKGGDELREAFENVVREELTGEPPQTLDGRLTSLEESRLGTERCYPEDIPGLKMVALQRQMWDQIIHDRWPNNPQRALGGKSPLEAAGDPALARKLAGAMYAFEAYTEERGVDLDLDSLRSRLKLPAPATLSIGEDESIYAYTILEIRRAPLHELNDNQLREYVQIVLALGLTGVQYEVLPAVLARPQVLADYDSADIYLRMAEVCRIKHRREEAIAWINQLREKLGAQANFEQRVVLDLRELMIRAADPKDPRIAPIMQRIMNTYVPKLPQLREELAALAQFYELPLPAEGGPMAGSVTAGGIWTPSAPEPSGGGKLWLPGQE